MEYRLRRLRRLVSRRVFADFASSGVVSMMLIYPALSWSTDIIEIHGKSAKYIYVDGITGVYEFQIVVSPIKVPSSNL